MIVHSRAALANGRRRTWRKCCPSWEIPTTGHVSQPFLTGYHRTRQSSNDAHGSRRDVHREEILSSFKHLMSFPTATCTVEDISSHGTQWDDKPIRIFGYLGARRIANQRLVFAELRDPRLRSSIQLVSARTTDTDEIDSSHHTLQILADHTPVAIEGTIKNRKASKSKREGPASSPADPNQLISVTEVEIKVESVTPLNTFPSDIIMKDETVLAPRQRHLQIRNQKSLRDALQFRSRAARFLREHLAENHGFEEIETPLLFKSTPEGAREFLVPTRQAGLAYALPQSPQQYKQILMASGIPRYMQIARCFRDEDLRADRQPEFTQLDIEMAFSTGEDVMEIIESTIKALWQKLLGHTIPSERFERITYHEAMSKYGSDKPDVRLGSEIQRVDHLLPADLIAKLGPLTLPVVEAVHMRISDDPARTREFVNDFMDTVDARPFIENPDGQPGLFVIDAKKPLQGLQVFGFEAAEVLEDMMDLSDGDLVVLQARRDLPFAGGATPLGNMRLALHRSAVNAGLIAPPTGYEFRWVVDFPLFSPTNDAEPGQEGSAGIASTHHPFTAPKSTDDVDMLLTDPLCVKADHYDLVVNGVELGGGSRRIHSAQMQELILRDILAMSDERMQDFAHLLEVLRAGCPPHAGIALGFDRMIAIMLGKSSVRDVIAFPKGGRGEDMLVQSPSRMTEKQLSTYHLSLDI